MESRSALKSAVLGTLVFASLLLLPGVSAACRCTEVIKDPDTAMRHALARANVVFRGTVQTVTPTTLPNLGEQVNVNDAPYLPGTSGGVAAIAIEQIWKGNADISAIDLFIGTTLCDWQLEPGDRILLFVAGPDAYGYYTSNRCIMSFAAGSKDDQLARSLDGIDSKEIDAWRNDFITYGCGGGFAASYSDKKIYRDGRVTHDSFSHTGDRKHETEEVHPDATLADRVFGTVDYEELDSIDGMSEPGNYSCSVHARILGRDYSATWGGGQSRPSDQFRDWLKRLEAAPMQSESE
jgi:hypothetical protein